MSQHQNLVYVSFTLEFILSLEIIFIQINAEIVTIPGYNFDKGKLVCSSKTVLDLLQHLDAIVIEYFTSEILLAPPVAERFCAQSW